MKTYTQQLRDEQLAQQELESNVIIQAHRIDELEKELQELRNLVEKLIKNNLKNCGK